MKIQYLDHDPKEAAKAVPDKLKKQELKNAHAILGTAIRVVRGKPGEIVQTTTNIFKVKVDRIETYPLVLDEDEPTKPACPLATDTEAPTVMWALQSKQNLKWLHDYYLALGGESMQPLLKATQFEFPYKHETPPPYPTRKVNRPDPIDSWRLNLHFSKHVFTEAPSWWDQNLNDQLTKKS